MYQNLAGIGSPQGDDRTAYGVGHRIAPGGSLEDRYRPTGNKAKLHKAQLFPAGGKQLANCGFPPGFQAVQSRTFQGKSLLPGVNPICQCMPE